MSLVVPPQPPLNLSGVDRQGMRRNRLAPLFVDGDKVYARWTQHGHDRRADPPQAIRQITSAVFLPPTGLDAAGGAAESRSPAAERPEMLACR